ncbi:hypothetical protein PVAP13_2NG321100 [Panicum virgatum]|uniref:Uncharacterized protein n=1 Tax=Panicum virgatum TaxID=38727 RepID=A0A8T0VDS9_PANVG|nr:hypothetical protein PVAP13_2NG321100 [Panicum virgatum]
MQAAVSSDGPHSERWSELARTPSGLQLRAAMEFGGEQLSMGRWGDCEKQLARCKAPTKIRNSPIKLLVPGKLILAKVKKKKMVEKFGMVLTKPP